MTPVENLHYAIGELAYAIAAAKGKVQKQAYKIFHAIVEDEIKTHDPDFDVSDIIFQLLNKDQVSVKEAYRSAMHILETNSHYLSPMLKLSFIRVIDKVTMAFGPYDTEEFELVSGFKKEIESLEGDPVYYNQAG
jgi:hypothetical protein